MSESQTTHDRELGAALRELPVPEHTPGFDERLRRRLATEHPGHRRRRRPVALAAALLVAAIAAVGVPRVAGDGVDVASAAEVKASVRAALGSEATMQGRVVSVSVHPLTGKRETRRWRFAATADGDFRLDELDGPGRLAYDAATGVERQLARSESIGGGLFAVERSGLAPGRPDAGPSDWILQRDLGSVVRALMAARDPRVTEVRYDGREAWRVDVPVRPNAIYADADLLAVTVDQATGIPVRVVETLHGDFRRELRVEDLSLVAPLAPNAFELDFPRGLEVTRTTYNFRRVELNAVEPAVGYAPLVPRWVPDGFVRTEVAVARLTAPTGTEAGNPPSVDVVSIAYRRGFDRFVVTTRLARPPGFGSAPTWDDPLATGEGFVDRPESVSLGSGPLAGVTSELLAAPRGIPHLWGVTDRLVVTVGGDLDRSALRRIAESLRASRAP